MAYPSHLEQQLIAYYRRYYQDCGLPNYKVLATTRLKEEKREEKRLAQLQQIMSFSFNPGQKHCDIGAGTGGVAAVLHSTYQCDVYGVEPNDQEFSIIGEKCLFYKMNIAHFHREPAEHVSFDDNMFDVVHCNTVLEHVQDVGRCVKEMIRICKPGGFIIINTPNYLFPREGHYKIPAPTFMGKTITKWSLWMLGKPTAFLSSINFLTPYFLDQLLNKERVVWYRIYMPESRPETNQNFFGKLEQRIYKLARWLGVYPQQDIVIRKLQDF